MRRDAVRGLTTAGTVWLVVLEREAGVPLLEPLGRRVQLTAQRALEAVLTGEFEGTVQLYVVHRYRLAESTNAGA